MPDTIRSLAELNALLADNTSAAITPQDLRDLMVSQMVYAEIGSGAKAEITLGTGFQAVDLNVAGEVSRGMVADATNRMITDTPVNMKAIIHCEVVFKGAVADYEFSVFRNPDSTPTQVLRLARTVRGAATAVSHSWSTSVQLTAGDKLQLGVRANGQPFELLFGVLRVQRIGVE